MDLRMQKTLENIEKEFLALRENAPLNKIKINELCANAKINKSTFYRHYMDVFDLSDKLENETIDSVMRAFTAVGSLFDNPEEFISGLLTSIGKYDRKIKVLFRDRIDVIANKIESRLKKHYLASSFTSKKDIIMSFLIGGAIRVFLDPKYDLGTSTKTIVFILKNMSLSIR